MMCESSKFKEKRDKVLEAYFAKKVKEGMVTPGMEEEEDDEQEQ